MSPPMGFFGIFRVEITRPGNGWQFAILKMAIEIVDFPIKNKVIVHSYVSLPEGNERVFPGNCENFETCGVF